MICDYVTGRMLVFDEGAFNRLPLMPSLKIYEGSRDEK